MSYELISEEEYQNLPDDDDRCFVEFESICRRKMTRMIDENSSGDFDIAVREQYMASVAAVAAECHIPNILYNPDDDSNFSLSFGRFSLAVQGEVARIRIRSRGERHPYSVLLTGSTRTKIEHYIDRIRDVVGKSDLSPDQQRRLNEKLDQLIIELTHSRLSFAKTMALLVGVMTVMGSGVTIGAEGPSAVTHIMQLIGQDKETEEHAARRLAPPPKALPGPPAKATAPTGRSAFGRPAPVIDLEDDIPF